MRAQAIASKRRHVSDGKLSGRGHRSGQEGEYDRDRGWGRRESKIGEELCSVWDRLTPVTVTYGLNTGGLRLSAMHWAAVGEAAAYHFVLLLLRDK